MFNKLKEQAKAGIAAVTGHHAPKQTVLVFGATGSQGGSVAKALLQEKDKFEVRALTRNPTKQEAKDLEELGATIVKGDASDKESLKAAFDGVDAAFVVTQFWENFSEEKEITDGRNIIEAAKAANAKKPLKVVFSGLENVAKVTGGKISKCHHFNGKGILAEELAHSGVDYSVVLMSAYHQNYLSFFKPHANGDGTYNLSLPMGDSKLNSVDVRDIGEAVRSILHDFPAHKGKTIDLTSDLEPVNHFTDVLSKVTGKTIKYHAVSSEAYASAGFPGAEDLGAMFDFYKDTAHCKRDPAGLKSLVAKPRTFETWANENKEALADLVK